jgi:hypothetical protein
MTIANDQSQFGIKQKDQDFAAVLSSGQVNKTGEQKRAILRPSCECGWNRRKVGDSETDMTRHHHLGARIGSSELQQ